MGISSRDKVSMYQNHNHQTVEKIFEEIKGHPSYDEADKYVAILKRGGNIKVFDIIDSKKWSVNKGMTASFKSKGQAQQQAQQQSNVPHVVMSPSFGM